jgi:hypothetical protein
MQPAEKKRNIRPVIPFKNGLPASQEDDRLMEKICKTDDTASAVMLVHHAAAGNAFGENQDASLSVALYQMADLSPRSPLEAMLISQIVAVNAAIGTMMSMATVKGQYPASQERNLNLATKLQRTFLAQIETLQKLRGKGQQTVRVEHVHVHEGGQAIVGNVNHGSEGGRSKNGN